MVNFAGEEVLQSSTVYHGLNSAIYTGVAVSAADSILPSAESYGSTGRGDT